MTELEEHFDEAIEAMDHLQFALARQAWNEAKIKVTDPAADQMEERIAEWIGANDLMKAWNVLFARLEETGRNDGVA